MSRIKKTLTLGAIAGIALAGVAGPAAANNGHGSRPVSPETHKASYWGDDCEKFELGSGTTSWTVAPGTFVYIKAGTHYYNSDADMTGYGTISTSKDISFVIVCGGGDNGGGGYPS